MSSDIRQPADTPIAAGRPRAHGAAVALRKAIRYCGNALLDWRLGMLMGICAALLLILAQLPLAYSFKAGKERGTQSDLPFLQGFNDAEGWGESSFLRSSSSAAWRRFSDLGSPSNQRAREEP